ncbi:Protein CBG25375 [Caenorhabditis briggsae]|uniref:Protein CBG25374 n=1 Tax=Caenorhabditis briggsae TaxID=6238 RepID=G2J6R6_CAEBR|nr:Protein CBG25374 [Caenorhabditis briggsae]XP_045099330.1 Protein CBG25375 [Caenorhabditis briggsae]CAR99768.1 Protein CBG25374 [Caenorhabditis briggsae]CAR99769.1 Protein CBG25375 [Caenorhabditis briggsae]
MINIGNGGEKKRIIRKKQGFIIRGS